jgi:DNA-directed RNA polymerase specialized sigma24 family protein
MASRPRDRVGGASNGLSIEAAHHYARIYAAARAGCLNELRRAGCSEEEAEDIFAATLERVMRKRDPVGEGFGQAQTVALLKQACRQKLIDERRHRDVLRIVPLNEALSHCDPTSQGAPEAVEAREAVAIGREAIASLSERDRRIFLQRHHLGLSPEEILRRNPGLSPRTYRKVMQRANARALASFEAIGSGARCEEMRREQLRRYVTEQASDAERRTVGAHLRHCRACGVEVARMRGRLHEIASGLALSLVEVQASSDRFADLPARMLDAVVSGGEGLIGASRAFRERLRELAIRMTGGLPGSAGEGAVGQVAGISAAKVASVCAAGALTASCLAAGVVPGVGGLELDRHSRSARSQGPPVKPSAPVERAARTPARSSTSPSPPGEESSTPARRKRVARSIPQAPEASSARPTISGVQTGTELGEEAAGAGVPAPTFSSGAAGGGRSQSAGKPEFGL